MASVFHGAEIILCAGAIKSPHLLMLSGIGPADTLRALGINVIHSAPGVGKDFADHPDLWVTYRPSRDPRQRDGTAFAQIGLNYTADSAYPAGDMEILCVALSLEQLIFGRPVVGAVVRGAAQPARGATRDARQFDAAPAHTDENPGGSCVVVWAPAGAQPRRAAHPSGDPRTPPVLDYRYLSDPSDLRRLRDGVRIAVALLKERALRGHVARRTQPTDDDLEPTAPWSARSAQTSPPPCT